MRKVNFGKINFQVPAVVTGCMRFAGMSSSEMNKMIHSSIEMGAYFFDHADIYGGGKSEEIFGDELKNDKSIKREEIIIQTKCGINSKQRNYDQSKEYILNCVDNSLRRLKTDYIDVLLLHRPDALVEPEEVAEAFDILQNSGKVKMFGVSNHKPMQIELLKKCVKQDIVANQLQFSIPVSNMIANGMEVNMTSDGAIDRDGSVLDYSRLKDITVQAWSPFQMPQWKGCFIGSDKYPELNKVINELSEKYNVSISTVKIIKTVFLHGFPLFDIFKPCFAAKVLYAELCYAGAV